MSAKMPSSLEKVSSSQTIVDHEQTLKASNALLSHIKKVAKEKTKNASKQNILDDVDADGFGSLSETPIWLTVNTKTHTAKSHKLKPVKVAVPTPLHSDSSRTICLITADPSKVYSTILDSPSFPSEIQKRISVVGFKKLKTEFRQFEAQRKLAAEHDIFLADDRIINRLPQTLGKTFYKSTTKRPIPVVLSKQSGEKRGPGQRRPDAKEDGNAGTPLEILASITAALNSALLHLSPSTSTVVRVGFASWTANQIAGNVEAVVAALVEKHVPLGLRNIKGIFLKGPETASLPVWQADELWVDAQHIAANETEEQKAIKAEEPRRLDKKRKLGQNEAAGEETKPPAPKKSKLPESNDDNLDKQIAERKQKLKKQKAAARRGMEV